MVSDSVNSEIRELSLESVSPIEHTYVHDGMVQEVIDADMWYGGRFWNFRCSVLFQRRPYLVKNTVPRLETGMSATK